MQCSHIRTSLALSSTLALGLATSSCGSGDASASGTADEDVASVEVAVTTVPTSTQCIRITATQTPGTATSKTFPVSAGSSSASLQVGPFVPGIYTLTGDAFNVACSSIGSNVASWTADPVPLTLKSGVTTSVTMTFRKLTPVTVAANFVNNVVAGSTGQESTLIATDAGVLQAGQLSGARTFVRLTTSTALDSGVKAVSATTSGACALRVDGTVWCWGYSGYGELGPGIPVGGTSTTPTQVTGLSGATLLTAGAEHTCALGTYSSTPGIYCWGNNGLGQLGNNTGVHSSTPVRALNTSGNTVLSLAAGTESTYAVNSTGVLSSWGSSYSGQLGDGTMTFRLSPGSVWAEYPVQAVVAGAEHACALHLDGKVHCWGYNGFGALGINSTTTSAVPVEVPNLVAQQIVAGSYHTCALNTAGQTLCWGSNSSGQIGDGTVVNRLVPTAQTIGAVAFASLFANAYAMTTCGLTAASELYCWGENYAGQVGDGTNATAYFPKKALLQ